MCDPLGFPRNMVFELRGIAFATMPDRILVLNQYQRAWREIWMDGRELPKNVGGTAKDAPDPRYYGYSAGHWEGDNTLVVETTGWKPAFRNATLAPTTMTCSSRLPWTIPRFIRNPSCSAV